ncbi:IS66-like element accessory protein TnpA [Mesorhizobium sp. BHbsci]
MSVSEVARSAGVHVSQLFRWRKELCDPVDTGASQLVPVVIVPAGPSAVEAPASSASPSQSRRKGGIIEIELGGGRRVRVDRDVDAEALRRVPTTAVELRLKGNESHH